MEENSGGQTSVKSRQNPMKTGKKWVENREFPVLSYYCFGQNSRCSTGFFRFTVFAHHQAFPLLHFLFFLPPTQTAGSPRSVSRLLVELEVIAGLPALSQIHRVIGSRAQTFSFGTPLDPHVIHLVIPAHHVRSCRRSHRRREEGQGSVRVQLWCHE